MPIKCPVCKGTIVCKHSNQLPKYLDYHGGIQTSFGKVYKRIDALFCENCKVEFHVSLLSNTKLIDKSPGYKIIENNKK